MASWHGTDATLIAGRLAYHLGSSQLGRRLHLYSHRHDRKHAEAAYYFCLVLFELRGPLAAWHRLKDFSGRNDLSPQERANLHSLRARAASVLRDFETSDNYLKQAEIATPDQPWLKVERAYWLEAQDQYEAALGVARESLALAPWYRPGVQSVAHLLQLLNRDEEALDFLRQAVSHIESSAVLAQTAAIELELRLFTDASRTLDRCDAAAPLKDKAFSMWLNASRCDAAYQTGDLKAAAGFARLVDTHFYQQFSERLARSAGEIRRVRLPVGFVRQHHKTCAPATLTAISNFWKKPAEHLSLAEKICYDGTPAYSERSWAAQNGWSVREFKVTKESAVALLDQNIPFTLTTVDPGNAHLQAVMGYDSLRECLLVRDPYFRFSGEFIMETALVHYRSTGPRGMALVPEAEAGLLGKIDLPEAELYDELYSLQGALDRHERPHAAAALLRLQQIAPAHRLTLSGRAVLARYDSNLTEMHASMEEQLKQFPDDVNLQLARISCLQQLSRQQDRVAALEKICATKNSDPLLWEEYAAELSRDARQHGTAKQLFRRALRWRPTSARSIHGLGNICWGERQFVEAVELYRFAACLDNKNEYLAECYFTASRAIRQSSTAMNFLTTRFQIFGKQSHFPARTLFWANLELNQTTTAFAILETALIQRPEDGALLLFAADAYARYANESRATDLLKQAEGRASKIDWLRRAAALAGYRGDLPMALNLWEQVLTAEPLAMDANRAMADLLNQTRGPEAALQHLEGICGRFPCHFPLHQLWIEWLERESPARAESGLQKLLQINPVDAWTQRELAIVLGRQNRFDEAAQALAVAMQIEPNSPAGFHIRGWLLSLQGNRAAAAQDWRQSLSLSVDFAQSINSLLANCISLTVRKEALAFIEQELIRQTVFGDGLLAYRDVARPILEPEALLLSLRKALEARPDLWHAWSSVINQLLELQRFDEALELSSQATDRFPLLPRLWYDLAVVQHGRLNLGEEIGALEKAVQINPAWGLATRQLANALRRNNQSDQAVSLLERTIIRSPSDPLNHGVLAEILWQGGQRDRALECLRKALDRDRNYDWGWRALQSWARDLKQPELPANLARELTARRPGEAAMWIRLADNVDRKTNLAEAMEALDRAVVINPRSVEAYDLKATLLATAKRFDEARIACSPPAFDRQPHSLLAREAWVEQQQGNFETAIAKMKAALVDDPGNQWGWKEMAGWYWNRGLFPQALEAAQRIARLSPLDPVPLGYAGDIKARLGDRAGAKADFARALTLDPQYEFGGFRLFEMQLEDGALAEAAKTLEILRRAGETDQWLARETQLLAQQGQPEKASAALRRLALSTSSNAWPINFAAESLVKIGWGHAVEKVMAEALENLAANPEVGVLWLKRRFKYKNWSSVKKLDALRGEISRRAVIYAVEQLGTAKRDRYFRRVLRRHRDWLRSDTAGWGQVGYAFITMGKHKEGIEWLKTWREHPKAESWMLFNLALALRRRKHYAEADEVIRHTLRLQRERDFFDRLDLWAAMESVMRGDTQIAIGHLAKISRDKLSLRDKRLCSLVQGMIEIQQAKPPHRAAVFRTARKQIASAFGQASVFETEVETRHNFRRALGQMARDSQSLVPRIWATWFYLRWAWLLVPIIIPALILILFVPFLWPVLLVFFRRGRSK